MLVKNILFSIFVLQAFKEVICKKCNVSNDCQTYTSCEAAIQYQRKNVNYMQKFRQAYCGFDRKQRRTMVCCSDFANKKVDDVMESKLKLLPESCGDFSGNRIMHGRTAGLYEFPWMAIILKNQSSGYVHCAGSIINSRYILTAAHCVLHVDLMGVRVGEYDISTDEDCQESYHGTICESNIQDFFIEKIISHEMYNSDGHENDIALIRVDEDIDFSYRNAKAICLPISEHLRKKRLIGESATIAGWGRNEMGEPSLALMRGDIPIQTCEANKRNVICAGDYYIDSCNGDSGGPLLLQEMYKNVERYVQYGIVSSGKKTCTNAIGIYTDVTKYIDWILDKIQP